MLGRIKVMLMFVAMLMVFTLLLGSQPSMAGEESELMENTQAEMPESPAPPEMLGSRDVNIRVNVMPGAGVGNGRPYTWPGRSLRVWGNVTNGTSPYTYNWTFGDGSPAVSGAVTDVRNIEVLHSYATLGQKKAILTVTDADGDSDVDTVTINVAPFDMDVEINAAIHDGLHWLYLQQYADGSWSGWTQYGTFTAAATAQAIVCFENDGFLPIDDADKNIYVDCIRRGLDYVTANLSAVNIGPQAFCNPEEIVDGNTDNNGLGVYAYNNGRPTYAIGIIMMALVGSGDSTLVANTGPVNVIGRKYYDLVVDMVDYCAWAQVDVNNYYRGGWRYNPNDNSSDNSVSQWPAIGLEAAETQWKICPPPCVKSELTRWVSNSRDGSGCYRYTTSGGSLAMTGAGLCELAFCDIPASDSRFQAALNCLCNRWSDGDNKGFYYGMYAISKGLRIAINDVGMPDAVDSICGSEWYPDYARYLIDRQYADGSWPNTTYMNSMGIHDDQWAILVLEPGWTSCLTFAEINAPDTVAPSVAFAVDGLSSDNSCGKLEINEWLWDFDITDGVDWDHPDASGAEVTVPGYVLPNDVAEGSFVITLRVRDNAPEPKYDEDSKTIIVDRGNHAPVADCGGPYSGKVGEVITFDGTGSWDPDEVTLEDYIADYAWDLDGDGQFDDCYEPICTFVWDAPYTGKVGLMVQDRFDRYSSTACIVDIVIDTVDLYIEAGDISFIQLPNDSILISATVHCSTYVEIPFSVEPFKVRFYDGDPDVSSVVIGTDQIISDMVTGETRTVSVKWAYDGEECHNIFVRVDPWSEGFSFGDIPEYNEWFNNEAQKAKCPCGDNTIILPTPMRVVYANYVGWLTDTVIVNAVIDTLYFGSGDEVDTVIQTVIDTMIVEMPPLLGYMFIGGFSEEYPARDLDLSSVRVNDTIVPTEIFVRDDVPVFPGEEVLFIMYNVRQFILYYGWVYDFYDYKFTVTGLFSDETPYEECGLIPIRGHTSGDINSDGIADISDLTIFISYLFQGQEMEGELSAADVNHDGYIDISDLALMVSNLFG